LNPSKDGKGWQSKISLDAPCPMRITPVNSAGIVVAVNGGANANPVLRCSYGAYVDPETESQHRPVTDCIEFSAYFRAAFGDSNPFTEISRAETNARQQTDLGHISAEDGVSKIAQMRKDFGKKAGQALDELDEYFVDIIAAAKVDQIDVCDQDPETFSPGESVSAALCKPVRGTASALNDPSITVDKTVMGSAKSPCPASPEKVDSALDSEQTTQADRHAYLVSQLCSRFTWDVRLSPLLAARGFTLHMVDKSGVVEGARKAVESSDTSIAFPQPPLPTYRQINFRLQEMEYKVSTWYYVLHNGGRHDLIGGKTRMVPEPRVGNVELATLSIAALCDKNADANSIEGELHSGGQFLEDGSGWQLGASHSNSCVQFVLAFPPHDTKVGSCPYGSDSPGAPCRHAGQLYNVVRHAQPHADPAAIASYFDAAFTRFEAEFVKAYGTPVHD